MTFVRVVSLNIDSAVTDLEDKTGEIGENLTSP